MKKRFSRGMAFVIAFLLMFQTLGMDTVTAAGLQANNDIVTVTDPVSVSGNTVEDTKTVSGDVVSDNTISEDTVSANADELLLNYIWMDQPTVTTPDTHHMMASIGTEDVDLTSATLHYKNTETGKAYALESTEALDNTLLFEKTYNDDSLTGIYELTSIDYKVGNTSNSIDFAKIDLHMYFGVNKEVATTDTTDLGELDASDIEASIVTINEDGTTTAAQSISEAIAEVKGQEAVQIKKTPTTISQILKGEDAVATTNNVVVVLDPGHDATHTGAQVTVGGVTYKEHELNLKIAKYCKDELNKYAGITTYLTRDSAACPYGGDAASCLVSRVNFAKSKGANIFVSIHLNSNASASPRGEVVYYPNSNYNSSVYAQGNALAKQIKEQLIALGIPKNGDGMSFLNGTNTYPDGSQADYYSVIRNSKLAGFPGIIVEHAFLSNASDVTSFLSSDEKLKSLGVADAKGIVSYFGLTADYKATSISILNKNDAAGTFVADLRGVTPLESIQKVQFAVWTKADGSDLHWYDAIHYGNGTYQITIDAATQGGYDGTYMVHAYATDNAGNKHFLLGTSCALTAPTVGSVSVGITPNATKSVYTATGTGAENATKVKYAVWSETNGQDDLVWYTATKDANGKWVASIPIANHKTSGTYYVYAYGASNYGNFKEIGANTFTVTGPQNGTVSVFEAKPLEGSFHLIISPGTSPSGITNVRVAVWNQGLSDLKFYDAVPVNGIYLVKVDIANHKYRYGNYTYQVFATDGNGIQAISATGTTTLTEPQATLTATPNPSGSKYMISATNVGVEGGVSGVTYAVWSEAGGQDDMKLYGATQNEYGAWSAEVPISNHKTAGTYNVMMAVNTKLGTTSWVKQTTFNVTGPSSGTVSIMNKNNALGTYDMVITPGASASGIKSVRVGVWNKGMSDLKFYDTYGPINGSYLVKIDIANHGYAYGNYQMHVYATDGNGIEAKIAEATTTLTEVAPTVTATKNTDGTQYSIKSTNVCADGGVANVMYAVWSDENGRDDLAYYTAVQVEPGVWGSTVPIINHKSAGKYYVQMAVNTKSGKTIWNGDTTFTVTGPSGGSAIVAETNNAKGTFTLVINPGTSTSEIKNVDVAVWCKGISDLRSYPAFKVGNGMYLVQINAANHDNNYGTYVAQVTATDANGIRANVATVTNTLTETTPIIVPSSGSNSTEFNIATFNLGIDGGVSGVTYAVWSTYNGQDDLKFYSAGKVTEDLWGASVPIVEHNNEGGQYTIQMGVTTKNGTVKWVGQTTYDVETLYKIQGTSGINVFQMMAYYNSKATYPTYYATSDAPTLQSFCQMYLDECAAEGIKAEVAFAQAMKETNFLKYTGDVAIAQYNFAGIGATGNGAKGESYATVRTGIRAQIQHLKAYCTSAPLNNPCVDTRYTYVTKGSAPYVEWLGIQENPYGKGWATAKNYGASIISMIKAIKQLG